MRNVLYVLHFLIVVPRKDSLLLISEKIECDHNFSFEIARLSIYIFRNQCLQLVCPSLSIVDLE